MRGGVRPPGTAPPSRNSVTWTHETQRELRALPAKSNAGIRTRGTRCTGAARGDLELVREPLVVLALFASCPRQTLVRERGFDQRRDPRDGRGVSGGYFVRCR
eukprot:1594297-Rhodomonas_salina.1